MRQIKFTIKVCPSCNQNFSVWYSNPEKKYCSQKCYGETLKNTKPFLGKSHSFESNLKNRMSHLGIRKSVKTEFKKGQKPWNWQGGSSKERVLIAFPPLPP